MNFLRKITLVSILGLIGFAASAQVTVELPNCETPTTVVNNNDGTFTYTNELGVAVTLDACQLIDDGGCSDSFVDNGDGSFTHTALDGTVVTFSIPAASNPSVVTDLNNGNLIATHNDGQGTITNIEETITTLLVSDPVFSGGINNDSLKTITYTYTQEDIHIDSPRQR